MNLCNNRSVQRGTALLLSLGVWSLTLPSSHVAAQTPKLVVSEYFARDTMVFDPSGQKLCMFGTTTGVERFYDIAFNQDGSLFVTGSRTNNIWKFSPTGKDLGEFAQTSFGAQSIAVDQSGNIYVAGDGAFVEKFDSNGVFLGHFAATAGSTGNSVAFDKSGVLYLAGFDGGSVRRFAANGADLGVFATGLSAGQGMVLDSFGNLYVSERGQYGAHLHRIHKFSPSGFDLGTFGAAQLVDPVWMTMGSDDVLYVADYGSTAVRKFSTDGVFLGDHATNLQAPSGIAFQPVPFEKVAPTTIMVNLGAINSGNVASLASDDGNPLNVCKAFVPNVSSPFLRFVVKGTASLTPPQSLTFRVRSRMIQAGSYQQTLRLYSFQSGTYDEVQSGPLTTSLQYFDLAGKGDLSRYVGNAGILQSQVEVKQIGFAATAVPCASFEFMNWNITS